MARRRSSRSSRSQPRLGLPRPNKRTRKPPRREPEYGPPRPNKRTRRSARPATPPTPASTGSKAADLNTARKVGMGGKVAVGLGATAIGYGVFRSGSSGRQGRYINQSLYRG